MPRKRPRGEDVPEAGTAEVRVTAEDRVTEKAVLRVPAQGHITRDCPSKERCQAEDCGKMHATILQEANWQEFRDRNAED